MAEPQDGGTVRWWNRKIAEPQAGGTARWRNRSIASHTVYLFYAYVILFVIICHLTVFVHIITTLDINNAHTFTYKSMHVCLWFINLAKYLRWFLLRDYNKFLRWRRDGRRRLRYWRRADHHIAGSHCFYIMQCILISNTSLVVMKYVLLKIKSQINFYVKILPK